MHTPLALVRKEIQNITANMTVPHAQPFTFSENRNTKYYGKFKIYEWYVTEI
jgi:hypothetical protein